MTTMIDGVFITGTDTGVGKTWVSAAVLSALAKNGIRVAGVKPVASGFEQVAGDWVNEDVEALKSASSVELPVKVLNRYAFKPAIAPHIAAQEDGRNIDIDQIYRDVCGASELAEFVVVEGVGGWHVPLSSESEPPQDIESLAVKLKLPVIMVVGLRLGCLNHALLTSRAIAASGLTLQGWVANHIEPDFPYVKDNLRTLEQLLPCARLFELPFCNKNSDIDHTSIEVSTFFKTLVKRLKNS